MRTLSCTMLALTALFLYAPIFAEDSVPTGRLPRNVVPTLVTLELKLDPRQERFSGRTRIEAEVAAPTNTVWMHGRDLSIDKAEIIVAGGRRIALTAQSTDISGVLKLTSPERIPAGPTVIEIAYEAPFGELQGAYRARSEGNDYIVTQMQPLGARNTFPGFDEPSFMHPWDIVLIVPEQDVAVANTRETRTEALGDGWKKVTFDRTEALPSYLIAFAVGPWDLPQGPDIAPHGTRATPIKFRGVAARGQGGRMQYTLANTPAMMHAMEDYFGTPYPFDKLDNVAAPDFSAGAMENAGLIVYRDSLMFVDERSAVGLRQAFWRISAHELAHQWFGNLVTMQWWDDLWLSEAFATWLGNKITGRLQPQFHTDRNILEGGIGAMEADSLVSTRRIHQPIDDFRQIISAFDRITYQKGGAVLAMFENYIGEVHFRDAVRNYLSRHARGNATSADLIAAVAAQSTEGKALDAAFKSYIDQPGVPFLQIDVECGGGQPVLHVRQQRYRPIGSSIDTEQVWGIPLSVRYQDGAQVREEKGIISKAHARFELKDAKQCPTWVMPNGQGAGYFRFALTPRWQRSLSDAFADLEEREQRVYADSIISSYDAGFLAPRELLAALPQLADAQTRNAVVAGLPSVRWMREHLLDGKQREAVLAAVAGIFRPRLQQLGLESRNEESDDDRLLRAALVDFFAQTLKDEAVRDVMNERGRAVLGLTAAGKLDVAAVSQDLRATALAIAVQDGGRPAFDAAEKHFRASEDPVLRGQLLSALGRSTEGELAARARALVFEKNVVRRNEIFALANAQSDETALRPDLRRWLDEHFDELETRLAPGGAALVDYYAIGSCHADDAAGLEKKFGQRVQTIEGGPLALRQARERIELCAAAKRQRLGQPLQSRRTVEASP